MLNCWKKSAGMGDNSLAQFCVFSLNKEQGTAQNCEGSNSFYEKGGKSAGRQTVGTFGVLLYSNCALHVQRYMRVNV